MVSWKLWVERVLEGGIGNSSPSFDGDNRTDWSLLEASGREKQKFIIILEHTFYFVKNQCSRNADHYIPNPVLFTLQLYNFSILFTLQSHIESGKTDP
jgi:hypothetical protein